MSFITICVLLLSAMSAVAGTITGKVIDSVTKNPVQGATVVLTSPPCTTLSAEDGKFVFELPETRIIYPVKPKEISAIPATVIVFDLNGRKLPERKVFPAGIAVREGKKFLLVGRLKPSFNNGMAEELKSSALRKTASAGFILSVSADGYQSASKEIDEESGDVGEILLSPQGVILETSINLEELKDVDIDVGITPIDSVIFTVTE